MHPYCFFDGEIRKNTNGAHIALNDLGILRGLAVFDFLRIYNGKPFLFEEHFNRFANSSKQLKLPFYEDRGDVLKTVLKLIRQNNVTEGSMRMVLTGGAAKTGMKATDPCFYILIEKLDLLPQELYRNGAKLITYEHQRQFPTAKTTDYIQATVLQEQKEKAGAVEILYINNGKILEASTSNFFVFIGDTLVTPRENILLGTTRKFVLDLAKNNYETGEREVLVNEIDHFDEAFITATNKEIVPIVHIDNTTIGSGVPGKKTKHLMELFEQVVQPEIKQKLHQLH